MFSSLFVCLYDCLLAILRKTFRMDLHEIFREGWQWDNEQMIKFWWRSESVIYAVESAYCLSQRQQAKSHTLFY